MPGQAPCLRDNILSQSYRSASDTLRWNQDDRGKRVGKGQGKERTKPMQGKTVFITGASSGLGASLARELVGRGAAVGLLARRGERLRELAEELREAGGRAAWAAADVTDGEGLHAACDALAAELGEPDVVVANAGWNRSETMERFKPGRALAIYDTNLLGFVRLVDWALPRFLERGAGHVVGVASMASFYGLPANAAYSGSKAAMRLHLQSLRISLKKHGIAVTTISPGFVESELTERNDYPMPFLWPTERATRLMADAIQERRPRLEFPWQMRLLVTYGLGRLIPRRLSEWLLARAAR